MLIIPLRTDSPLRSIPYMNYALILANIAVFSITMSHPNLAEGFGLSARLPQLHQFFTYQFIHAGWIHIIGNMLFLYIFGNNINDRLGHVGYLALYIGGGVFAAIAYALTSKGDAAQMVGASGAISAVTGAYLALLPGSRVSVFYFFYIVGVAEIGSLWFIAFFFAYDIFLHATSSDSVAHMAHAGGTVYGFLIGASLLMLRLAPRDPFDLLAMIQRWNRRRQYREVVASGYNPFAYPTAEQPGRLSVARVVAPPDARSMRALEIRSEIAQALAAHDLNGAARWYVELKMLDPQQVLSRQAQLDIANHLASQQQHAQAAEAYETFLRHYGKSEGTAQVELMLGLIYARYLNQPGRAREYLRSAASKYHVGRELDLAREELARLGPPPVMPPPPIA